MSGHTHTHTYTHTHTHTHTYTHTYTHDNYNNPRCAHAHRGLTKILSYIMIQYRVSYRIFAGGGSNYKGITI